ncbi:cytochrome P450 [Aspergillus campestris IBT 28561]|uniref:Cytochrome P450 n=1 Tax=Aspergillus campestris (strain IBT 28561) TaxID=1392248 RepID=A0A2I1DA43_ASPC2|nr:cytochrome P450 [Aspergillus campestris IBT 28561]PKY06741.1 cytochrome P450 [Aspergillus campestris IBT 28561]
MLDIYRLFALGALVTLGVFLSRRQKRDPREPPAVGSSIPIIGHLLGLLWYGTEYFSLMAEKYNYPIFSLSTVVGKFYVVTSPALLQAVQRNKSLTFDLSIAMSAERIVGIRGRGVEILRGKQSGGQGLTHVVTHATNSTLSGRPLDRMNERMTRLLRPLVDELATYKTVDLYSWCSHAITMASTEASYGPLNPYKRREIEDAFWAFESNLSPLMANIVPQLTARKAWKGRESMVKAFVKYYRLGGYKDGSEMTRIRYKTLREGGLTIEDIARSEVIMGIALLTNTVPATFWLLFELCSRPELLEETRQEVAQNALRVTDDNVHVIDISALRDNCPLLVSAFQEVLRIKSTSSPIRFVMDDLVLANGYLLRSGSVISMPGPSIGRDPDAWGATAGDFNPKRFLKTSKNPRRPGGLMTFGVSPVLCPGRHFASSEILGMVAMMILRYDLVPVDGKWDSPPGNSLAITSTMRPLKSGFAVRVSSRKEFEGATWDCEAQEGNGMFNLMVG